MRKNILVRTNLLVCAVIILGFAVTSLISYRSNLGIFRRDVENVSALTLEGIGHEIESIFTKPIHISMTMANDSLLKDFLADEQVRLDDEAFLRSMREYLEAYRVKYAYDSVFLVSAATDRYYHFNGLDRVLAPGEAEDVWYTSNECAVLYLLRRNHLTDINHFCICLCIFFITICKGRIDYISQVFGLVFGSVDIDVKCQLSLCMPRKVLYDFEIQPGAAQVGDIGVPQDMRGHVEVNSPHDIGVIPGG